MARVKAYKVKILKKDPLNVVLKFIDKNCTVRIPWRYFKRRVEMGIYEIENPDAKMTAQR